MRRKLEPISQINAQSNAISVDDSLIENIKKSLRDFNQRIASPDIPRIGNTEHTTRIRNVASLGDWSAVRLASALGSAHYNTAPADRNTMDTLIKLLSDADNSLHRLQAEGITIKYR